MVHRVHCTPPAGCDRHTGGWMDSRDYRATLRGAIMVAGLDCNRKSYWSKARRAGDRDGHFVSRSNNVKCFTVSKAIDSLTNRQPKVLFMT